ncbi:MAG: DUF4142 domain-containing protein [Agriterribacter sp.]
MKKLYLIFASSLLLGACNSTSSDPVEKADSTNEAKQEQPPVKSKTLENTSNFLVKAADGGMAEVDAGKLGEQKAMNKEVKSYAAMMVKDHGAANDEVKALASKLNITLPTGTSEDNSKNVTALSEKKPKDFDKDFMDKMIDDHKKTIDLFKDASDDDIDTDVKTFIDNTIPKLQAHLDSAEAIKKTLK